MLRWYMDNCVFCKILNGEIPSERFYEDELMIIIKDISPRARLHYLAVPKKHYKLLTEMSAKDAVQLGKCLAKIGEIADTLGLENGYRLIINQGDDALQTVPHLHVHIMGGEKLAIENGK